MSTEQVTRPLLRHFGGKWQLRHWIIEHLPPHQFYAEPFAGGAAVLLAKSPAPRGEIINDLNGETINLFRVMQDASSAAELCRRLEWTPYSQAELKVAAEKSDDPIERARRVLIRSFMGIEGTGQPGKHSGFRMGNVDLRRFDQEGKRTFRNCAADWSNWKASLHLIRDRLARVMIYERDALEFIRLMDSPQCLLYVDPPYHQSTRSSTRYVVDFAAHQQLAELLMEVEAMVVLSGYDCADYSCLEAAGWRKVEKDYRANMSLRRRTECLWLSPRAVVANNGALL